MKLGMRGDNALFIITMICTLALENCGRPGYALRYKILLWE